MVLSELRSELNKKVPVTDWDSLWDSVDERDFVATAKLMSDDDDKDFPADDDEQDWPTALSLLETAQTIMTEVMRWAERRNIAFPADIDQALTTNVMDIKQFVSDYEESKTTVMGPVRPSVPISYPCAHENHAKCDVVRCTCVCHDDEVKG
jgi:hypothetical protein